MITINVKEYNTFSQNYYDSVICSLQFHQLQCTCGHTGCLTIHGYYQRSVKTPDGTVRLRICRVICSECGKTHALLLSSFVPYSQVPLETQVEIIQSARHGESPSGVCRSVASVDENNIKSIIRAYRLHWKERLRSESLALHPLIELIRGCFTFYSMQFMQIRRTVNTLFSAPT